MDTMLKIVMKFIVYITLIVVLTVILFRGVIGALWGSHTDVGVLAAPFVGALGLCGILWIAVKLIKDLEKDRIQMDQGNN